MWQAWVNVIAGIWALLSSFTYALTTPTNFFITGAVIAVFGFWAPRGKWQGVVNGILGVWLIISSFVPELVAQANLLVVGLAVAILAAWRAAGGPARQHHPTQRTAHQ